MLFPSEADCGSAHSVLGRGTWLKFLSWFCRKVTSGRVQALTISTASTSFVVPSLIAASFRGRGVLARCLSGSGWCPFDKGTRHRWRPHIPARPSRCLDSNPNTSPVSLSPESARSSSNALSWRRRATLLGLRDTIPPDVCFWAGASVLTV
jgi:hypothetical protein